MRPPYPHMPPSTFLRVATSYRVPFRETAFLEACLSHREPPPGPPTMMDPGTLVTTLGDPTVRLPSPAETDYTMIRVLTPMGPGWIWAGHLEPAE